MIVQEFREKERVIMKPVIGIAGNHDVEVFETESIVRSYVSNGFVKGVQHAGGIPFIIPISDPSLAEEYISKIDGLILAGGQDVSPYLYEEEPHLKLGQTYPERDRFEVALIKEAHKRRIPIFGICRGLQILNVAFGGSLYQDLTAQYEALSILHAQKTKPSSATHTVTVVENTHLHTVIGEKAYVNSYHHQAVKELAPIFTVSAYSVDGVVEAIEAMEDGQSMLAVQWHPETMIEDTTMSSLFRDFIQRSTKQ